MEFHEQWINWVLETVDETAISKIGERCYQNSEWVKMLPAYSGEKDIPQIIAFLQEALPDFIYQPIENGFIVNLNEKQCFCPLVQSGITKNPNLCHCTKSFDQSMYQQLLKTGVSIKILKTILKGDDSCVFEVNLID